MKIKKGKLSNFKEFKELKKESIKSYSHLTGKKINISDLEIKKEFKELLSSKKRFLLLAEIDKKIGGYLIGTLIINAYQTTGYVDDIFVSEKFRDKKVGSSLIDYFIKKLKKKELKNSNWVLI